MHPHVSDNDEWPLLYYYSPNFITDADVQRVTQQEFHHPSYQRMRQDGVCGCVHTYM